MKLARIIALFLITALANPFCCCLIGDTSTSDVTREQKDSELSHACCMPTQTVESEQAPSAAEHSPDDCPHRYEKETLISHSADGPDSHVVPHLSIAPFLDFGNWDQIIAVIETNRSTFGKLDSTAPRYAEAFPQTYCVYLL